MTSGRNTQEPVVCLESVLKTYQVRGGEPVRALTGLDLRIAPGEVLGLLGRNGAGKSTVVKLVCGLTRPTGGQVTVLGQPPTRRRRALNRQLGAVFGQKTSLWWDLSVADNLAAMRGMYGIARADHRKRRDDLVEALSLGAVLTRPVRVLSLGERVKTELACALLHEPRVVLLDEPTIGLDLVSKHQLRAYLRTMVRSTGAGMLLTSHDTSDMTASCDRVALLERGSIVLSGAVEDVRRELDDDARVTVSAGQEPLTEPDCVALRELAAHDGALSVHIAEDRGRATVLVPSARSGEIFQRVLSLGFADRGYQLEVATASLEDALLARFNGTPS